MKKLSPSKAIRQKCLWCSMDSTAEVKECLDRECPLWPYRLGHGWQDPVTGILSKKTVSIDNEKLSEARNRGLAMARAAREKNNE